MHKKSNNNSKKYGDDTKSKTNEQESSILVSYVFDDQDSCQSFDLFRFKKSQEGSESNFKFGSNKKSIKYGTEHIPQPGTQQNRLSLGTKSKSNNRQSHGQVGGVVEVMSQNPTTQQSSAQRASIEQSPSDQKPTVKQHSFKDVVQNETDTQESSITRRRGTQNIKKIKLWKTSQIDNVSVKNLTITERDNDDTIIITKESCINKKEKTKNYNDGIIDERKTCFCCFKLKFKKD